MNLFLIIYSLAGTVLFLVVFPFFLIYALVTDRHREGLDNRLGVYHRAADRRAKASLGIWVHAASVGEVLAATPIIERLAKALPDARITLSTTTRTGQTVARETLGSRAVCIYAPIDLPVSVTLALQAVKPDVLVFVETEIWPCWLYLAHCRGIRTVMVNGRISARSARGYQRIRPLIGPVLATVDAFSMIHARDAGRVLRLGVPAKRVSVTGNAKYDRLTGLASPAAKRIMADLYDLAGTEPVLVAGSLRSGEEALLLDVFQAVKKRNPDLVGIFAPRHMHRVAPMAGLAAERGIDSQLRTGLGGGDVSRTAPLVILDTLGELMATYGIASVVFCGGSLVPFGGQNVLEPAAWGKPVLFGPWMEDFQSEKELLLASGGGSEVADGQALAAKIEYYLNCPQAAKEAGRAGQAAVQANTGAALRHVEVILSQIKLGGEPFSGFSS